MKNFFKTFFEFFGLMLYVLAFVIPLSYLIVYIDDKFSSDLVVGFAFIFLTTLAVTIMISLLEWWETRRWASTEK